MPQIPAEYPASLRILADTVEMPTPAYQALYLAAQNFENLLHALQAAQPDVGDNEVIVAVRFAVPNAENFNPDGIAAVSISAGSNVNPDNALILLGAHDAIVACARGSTGDEPCDAGERVN